MVAENTNYARWDELYVQAAVEVDPQKMPKRISAARRAIRGRLRDLEQDSDHHFERQKMENALHALATLETEIETW